MRTIKFRAWNTKHKYMDDTVFIRTCDGAVFDVPSVRFDTPNTEIELSNDLVIMQSTGWSDSKGVEIYDGDIAECNEHFRYEISWSEKHASWYASEIGGLDELPPSVKVIGNIYQNPELLK